MCPVRHCCNSSELVTPTADNDEVATALYTSYTYCRAHMLLPHGMIMHASKQHVSGAGCPDAQMAWSFQGAYALALKHCKKHVGLCLLQEGGSSWTAACSLAHLHSVHTACASQSMRGSRCLGKLGLLVPIGIAWITGTSFRVIDDV